MYRVV
jgi:hypothetical protein